jgi:hypothetical protein
MNKFATIITYLFHPLLMATYGCLLVFFGLTDTIYAMFTPLRLKVVITIIVFVFTFLLPVLNLLILYKLKYVSSLSIEERNQRTFPLILTSICYFGLFYMVQDFNIWPAIKLFVLGGGICILFTAIINIWWKISAHMIGIGGMFGVLLAMGALMQLHLVVVVSICILLAGIIGFARLYLNAHTHNQVYAGFAFGGAVQFLLFLLAQNFPLV